MDEGLRFTCQPGCTACCEVEGEVLVTQTDILRAAAFVGMEVPDFERRYVAGPSGRRRLKKPRHAQCFFLRGGGCSIHPAKPVQCRSFPFWPELVEYPANWEAASRRCPGINQGPLIPIEAIRRQLEEVRQAFPDEYRDPRAAHEP